MPKAREAAIATLFEGVTTAGDFWKTVRKVQGTGRTPIPPLVAEDGSYIVDQFGKAEILAEHFQSVFNRRNDIIPHFAEVPVPADFLCTEDFVLNEIAKVRSGCAPGPDGIFPCLLKEAAAYLAGPLTKIVNRSVTEREFPKCWKKTTISPIPKKRNDLAATDFRPITLLAITSKICEAHFLEILRLPLEENLSRNHFAYRKGRGTVDALQYHEHLICQGFETCRSRNCATNVIGVFFDVQKAFNSVTFGSLLATLERDFEIHPALLQLLRSYLTQRSYKVKVGSAFSALRPVLSGVPQGSKLGPFLFNAYVNCIADLELSADAHLLMYADDIAYVKPVTSAEDERQVQEDLDAIQSGLEKISLQLNVAKTKLMRFSVSPAPPIVQPKRIQGEDIERVDSFRYLGVRYDDRLSWKAHVRSKTVGLKRAVGALNSTLGKRRGHEVFRKIYTQQIFPTLSYAIPVWYPHLAEGRMQLEKAQRFALQTMQRNYTRTYPELLEFSRILPVSLTAASFRCRLVYLWYRELHFWPNQLPLTQELQVRRAERLVTNACSYHLPICRIDRANVSSLRQSVRIWNRVPTEWVALDRSNFYYKLKQSDLIGGLAAPLGIYSAYNNL